MIRLKQILFQWINFALELKSFFKNMKNLLKY